MRRLLLPSLAVLLCFTFTVPLAANRNEELVNRLSSDERLKMESRATLSPSSLEAVEEATAPDRVEALTREILELDSLAVGSRRVDEDGRSPIHHFIERHLQTLKPHGLEIIGSLQGTVAAPVSVDRLLDEDKREAPSSITVGERGWKLDPLWPNGAMPSLVPPEGLSGPLVDAGRGEWDDVKGLDLEGAIALMRFAGGRNFERLFYLGAQAVVVIEDSYVNRQVGQLLYTNTPGPWPRFYVDYRTGEELLERASRKEYADDGASWEFTEGEEATVKGGNVYERRPFETIFARLPATAPIRVTLRESTLIEWIARENNVTVGQLMLHNGLESPWLEPGRKLRIPRVNREYMVAENDLLERLAHRFDLEEEEILEANHLEASGQLPREGEIVIPNVDSPLLVFLPIDSVSVVPDAPHGAKAASNLALGLLTLEHIAAASNAPRRKDWVVVFVDADTLGGISSRTFAEYVLLHQGNLRPREREERADRLAHYRTALRWFEGAGLAPSEARWFVEQWLTLRLEDLRVDLAERRIGKITALQEDPPEEQRKLLEKERDRLSELLALMFDFRLETVESGRLPWPERIDRFREQLTEGNVGRRLAETGFTMEFLKRRFLAEMEEEETMQVHHQNNLDLVRRVMQVLNPANEANGTSTRLGWYFDFSSGSPASGLVHGGTEFLGRNIPASGAGGGFASSFQNITALAHVRGGWEEEWTFLIDDDRLEHPVLPVETPLFYGDMWAAANLAVLPIGARNDRLAYLDTPADVVETVDFGNLSLQTRNAVVLMQYSLESPGASNPPRNFTIPRYGRLVGQTVQFNIRSGLDAEDPVAGAYVYYPALRQRIFWQGLDERNTSAYRGARREVVRITQLNGAYRLPVENMSGSFERLVYAYHLDRATALFDKVMNRGQLGADEQNFDMPLREGRETLKNLVMADVYPMVFFAGTDPFNYSIIGRRTHDIDVIDTVLNGTPRYYGYDNAAQDYNELDVDTNILYFTPGRRATVIVSDTARYTLMLTGDVDEEGKGIGYRIGPGDDGDRNLVLPMTSMKLAENMLGLARYREDVYASFGVTSQSIQEALRRSATKIEEAREAMAVRDWQKADGAAREAWGILIKFYPRVLALGREAVFSVIFLMAFLVPAAFFLERLFISAKSIVPQLLGIAGFFSVGVIFLNFFHPAFRIAVSPFIVIIAFVMILMSIIVLALCYQRFEVLMRRARIQGGEVESEEIGFFSSMATAFNLGISNLKKRAFRSFLTAMTVTVLTFSIVAFVSVSGTDTVFQKEVPLDPNIEERQVEPLPPAYEGVVFRNAFWRSLPSNFVSAVRSEFGSVHDVTRRAFYVEELGGVDAEVEGRNQIEIRKGNAVYIVFGLPAFEPNETEFSRLHEAVSHGSWFRADRRVDGDFAVGDRNAIILPDLAAERLGITKERIHAPDGSRRPDEDLPRVRMMNRDWKVVGILDVEHADRIRDINGKSLAIVDFMRSAMTQHVGAAGVDLIDESTSYHLSWARLPILPYAAREDVGAVDRSVAIRFAEGTDLDAFFGDIALRLNRPVFAHVAGETSLVTTRQAVTVGGLAKIVVPVILCILIVLNTMLGTVEERKGEVGMLGAIGLSPNQISFLLLSESTVYSILGIVVGTFGGLFFANLVPWLTGQGFGFFSALSFNFTAMSAVGLALGTGVVVLMATLLPARKAAAMAAPSGMAAWKLPEPSLDKTIHFELPFTLTRGNALGMVVFFRQFLHNHTEPTSEGFNCRDVRVEFSEARGEPVITAQADLWLAPYDLDVAQSFSMTVQPTGEAGVFKVVIVLRRTSGNQESWIMTNYGYMDLVRKQFLLWRNLKPEERNAYIEMGAVLAKEALEPV